MIQYEQLQREVIMKISIELVPTNEDKLISELSLVQAKYPEIDIINIPDLTRYPLRSWTACGMVKPYYETAIPHIRAIDFDFNKPLDFIESLKEHQINDVLVLKGDLPQNMKQSVYTTSSIDLIRRLKSEVKDIKVYGAIDQYRTSMREEYEYIHYKLNAGVDGFFTQPFFDLRFLEMYLDMLEGNNLYIGLSPVVSQLGANYWRTKNNVIFPKDFEPTYAWNIDFAKKAMAIIEKAGANAYFMPIVVDLERYLDGVFER